MRLEYYGGYNIMVLGYPWLNGALWIINKENSLLSHETVPKNFIQMFEECCIERLMTSDIVHYKVTADVNSKGEVMSSFTNVLRRGEHVALLKSDCVEPLPLPIAKL